MLSAECLFTAKKDTFYSKIDAWSIRPSNRKLKTSVLQSFSNLSKSMGILSVLQIKIVLNSTVPQLKRSEKFLLISRSMTPCLGSKFTPTLSQVSISNNLTID